VLIKKKKSLTKLTFSYNGKIPNSVIHNGTPNLERVSEFQRSFSSFLEGIRSLETYLLRKGWKAARPIEITMRSKKKE